MLRPSLWAAAAAMTLFITCVTSNPVYSEEEWKSLSNPQSRILFYRILQSYFDGRGENLLNVDKVVTGLDSSAVDSYLDEHLHGLQSNSLHDV
ncbi:hypothetical protein ANANG_G00010560 [Anguilla anguilla]|uniref:Uncharacterized protein n=1 Tax=Anguilla anguilla TaxID=7936 RepID=A0A9D3N0R6_ANGAN|nr:hypothetical protein ANANG_G00010560 [Anguilla anguilla]